jgi:hypothetical protein
MLEQLRRPVLLQWCKDISTRLGVLPDGLEHHLDQVCRNRCEQHVEGYVVGDLATEPAFQFQETSSFPYTLQRRCQIPSCSGLAQDVQSLLPQTRGGLSRSEPRSAWARSNSTTAARGM